MVTEEKGWIVKEKMQMWYEKVWLFHGRSFENSLMIVDAFKAYFTYSVKLTAMICNALTIQVPGSRIIKVHLLEVCINKPFKAVSKDCGENYVLRVASESRENEKSNPSFKLGVSSKKDLIE